MILYLWEQSAYRISASYLASKWPKFFFDTLTNKTDWRKKPYIEAACCLKIEINRIFFYFFFATEIKSVNKFFKWIIFRQNRYLFTIGKFLLVPLFSDKPKFWFSKNDSYAEFYKSNLFLKCTLSAESKKSRNFIIFLSCNLELIITYFRKF